MSRLALMSLFALSLAACPDSSTGLTDADIACPSGSTLTYASYGAAAMTDFCLPCHNKERPLLSTQAQVQAAKTRIIDEAVFSTAMPEGRSMSLDQRKQLGRWLSCGAP